jgi:hypothetical protein
MITLKKEVKVVILEQEVKEEEKIETKEEVKNQQEDED